MLYRFKIYSAFQLSRETLLGYCLAASRLLEAARWQPLGTWPVSGKQNVQAKEVYWIVEEKKGERGK